MFIIEGAVSDTLSLTVQKRDGYFCHILILRQCQMKFRAARVASKSYRGGSKTYRFMLLFIFRYPVSLFLREAMLVVYV